MENIQVIKLISGEEIIGEITDIEIEGRQLIEVKNGAIILLMPQEDDPSSANIALAPWCPYADKAMVHVMPSSVTCVIQPKKQLSDEYQKMFAPAIFTPPKKEIIT